MAKSKFENELTLDRLKKRDREEEFHEQYEKAYETALEMLDERYPNLVSGEPRYSKRGEFQDLCPYDSSLIVGNFQIGSRDDVIDAVRTAVIAQSPWEETKVDKRCGIFYDAADEMAKRKYELSALLTLENGKNRYEAMAEVDEAIDYLRYYPAVLQEQKGYVLELEGAMPCNSARSILRPYGVVGVISPFNFPLALTTGMVTGALLTGNAVVMKPPTDAPLLGHMLNSLLVKHGVPPEVLSYVSGPSESVGTELISNESVSIIAFTGSREVGLEIAKTSAELGKRPPILEMGGKNPVIVSDKADLENAVEGIGRSAFGFSGQKCSATSRAIVHRSVVDKFTRMIATWVRNKEVGDPSKRQVFTGPVVNRAAVDRYRRAMIEVSRSGKLITGGHIFESGAHRRGYYVEPAVVARLNKNHEFASKELFLPILIVMSYRDFDEAIHIANSTDYGLTAGLFSDDEDEIQEFFNRIKAGVTYANRTQGATTGALVGSQPFTGWKASGVTGKGAGGPYYLLQFLQEQARTLCK